jgi:two-component system sensor histidine kinase/response regulator
MADIHPLRNPRDPKREGFHPQRKKHPYQLINSVLFLGLGVGLVYWAIASLITLLTAQSGTFIGHFLNPDVNELLNRLLVLCFFMFFGSQVSRTIRQRQKADEALAGSEEKHRIIIENIEDGYYEIDRDGRFMIFNNSFRNITGYEAHELQQLNYRLLLTPAETEKVVKMFDNVRRTGRAINDLGFVIVRKDATTRWVETSVSLITDRSGNPIGYRGLLRDVTRRHQADALKQEKMAAEAASRSKSEFLANMSHEIRTPLNAIIGLVEMLLDSSLSRDQREDLKVVQSAAYALLSVINDVLDFSKIEAGKLELERLPFNLRDFLGEALKILAVKAHEKNLELAYRVAPDVPDRLIGDPHRFRQVLLNLIGNAVKFTDSGEIVVFARIKSRQADQLLLHVAVRDTGVGIATGKQGLIFEAFRQADGRTNRKYGGTGLGLAVSAQLVNLMGGRIGVRSELGKGSIFHFTIAFNVAPNATDGTTLPGEIDLSGLKILVVDDNATNSRILCEMLSSWKMVAKPAASVTTGAALMRKLRKRGLDFDLALIDSELPPPGTLSLVQQLRQEAGDATSIIAMLTTTSTKEMDRFFKAGVKTMVTKPVRPSDLLDAIIQALSAESIPADQRSDRKLADQDFSLPPLDVLIAEDTPFNQKYIRRLLDSWHCRATIVGNGRQAVEALSRQAFDLVLMDVQMPEMDGLTATMQIREMEKKTRRHVPIIAMTAHAMRGDRERCLESGMDDYVPKPISSAALLETIRRILPVTEKPATLETAVGASTSTDDDRAMAALLDEFNNDRTLFKDIAEMFISDYPPMLVTIRQAIEAKDGPLLGRTAHSLKGMARNFQVDAAADVALRLEGLANQGQFAPARDLCRQLADELAAFEGRLRQMMERIS